MTETNSDTAERATPSPINMMNMFDRLAPFYDRVNKIISLGRDDVWRRLAVKLANGPDRYIALDVATGTGKMALALANKYRHVVGIDISSRMMTRGKTNPKNEPAASRIDFILTDALNSPFPDNTFDCVTIGFATRNVENLEKCFSEMLRVVKSNGTIVCLELSRPPHWFINAPYQLYLRKIVPFLGKEFSGQYGTYKYIAHSLQRFPPADELKNIMEKTGIRHVRYRRLNFGAVAIHWGIK